MAYHYHGYARTTVHTPPRTLSPILLKRSRSSGPACSLSLRILLSGASSSNSSTLSSGPSALSLACRLRRWRNFQVVFLFSFLITFLVTIFNIGLTVFRSHPCLSTYFKDKLLQPLHDNLNIRKIYLDDANEDFDFDEEDEGERDMNWITNRKCLIFRNLFDKLGYHVFFPSPNFIAITMITSAVMSFIITSQMFACPRPLPLSRWDLLNHSIPKSVKFSHVYGACCGLLHLIMMELVETCPFPTEEEPEQGPPRRYHHRYSSPAYVIGTFTSFLFGCLYYSNLEVDRRLLLHFPSDLTKSLETFFGVFRKAFKISQEFFKIHALLLISFGIVLSFIPEKKKEGQLLEVIFAGLICWWGLLWILSNFILELSQFILCQEIGLSQTQDLQGPFQRNMFKLSDGMCLSSSSLTDDKLLQYNEDELILYMRHLSIYEYYRTCTGPSQKTNILFQFWGKDLPIDFELTLDASFYILDGCRKVLQKWMECQTKANVEGQTIPQDKVTTTTIAPAKEPSCLIKEDCFLRPPPKGTFLKLGPDEAIGLAPPPPKHGMRSLITPRQGNPPQVIKKQKDMNPNLSIRQLFLLLLLTIWRRLSYKLHLLLGSLIPSFLPKLWRKLKLILRTYLIEPFVKFRAPDQDIILLNYLKSKGTFQEVSWIMAGVAEGTLRSLKYDKQGIAQLYLKQILEAYLDLFGILDKLSKVLGEKYDPNNKAKDENHQHLHLYHDKVKFLARDDNDDKVKDLDKTGKNKDKAKKEAYLKANYDYVWKLRNNCKWSLSRIHHGFRQYYALLEISDELKRKIIDIVY